MPIERREGWRGRRLLLPASRPSAGQPVRNHRASPPQCLHCRLRSLLCQDAHPKAGPPFPVYITTNADDLLEQALRETGRNPQSDFCRWNKGLQDYATYPSYLNAHPEYSPTPQQPFVYHLYGSLSVPESLVLTEDNYFDYVIGATADKALIPLFVRRRLADSLLLFLGFRMEEWKFRVLFRSIIGQEGSHLLSNYSHAAAQIDPEEGRILEPDRARKYLEDYFKGSSVSIFWGSVAEFVGEWVRRTAGAAAA